MILCSQEAAARGDSMLGTAPPQTRVLLVHQPGPWGPKGLVESRCDPEIARRLQAVANRDGMRLQAIRRPGKHEIGMPAGGYDVGIADTRGETPTITWWRVNDLAEMADELEAGWPKRTPDDVDTEPIFLICAHGRHDPCCALRGRPVAEALQHERPGRVWETTHLGGDRFAANVLVLPSGELYGRVPAEDAAAFAATAEAGNVIPELMRGKLGVPPPAQAALVYAYAERDDRARDAFRYVSMEERNADLSVVELAARTGAVFVTVAARTTPPALRTCHAAGNAKSREYAGTAISATAPSLVERS